MNVMQDITIDVSKPRQTVIHVVQEDSTRKIRLTLLKDNLPFDVQQDLTGEAVYGFVEFRKADGHGGMYDTTSLGDPAVELEDAETATNIWIVSLDGNCFTCPGWTQINVRFETEDGKRIHTFRIMVDVEPTASSDTESTDWGDLNSIADLRNAVGAMWDSTVSAEAKRLLMEVLNLVVFRTDSGPEYLSLLETELFQTADIVTISAVFDQGSAIIYESEDIENLRQYLTVTATYEDATTHEITAYTLSGTLSEGTSTITVSYGGKTATFDVAVTGEAEDAIFAIRNHTYNGSQASTLSEATPLTTDADYVIVADFTLGEGQGSNSYILSLLTANSSKGIRFDLGTGSLRIWNTDGVTNTNVAAQSGRRIKVVCFHYAGQNYTSFAYIFDDALRAVGFSTIPSSVFTTPNPIYAAGGGFVGTIHQLIYYDSTDDIMQRIKSIISPNDKIALWELGSISGTSGTFSDSNTRARTFFFLDDEITTISISSGYEALLYAWSRDGNYIGAWNGSAWATSASYSSSINFASIKNSYPNYLYRLMLRKTNASATISTAEAYANVSFS